MELYRWLLFTHICGVVLYVGGDLVLNAVAFRASRTADAALLSEVARSSAPIIGAGAVLTLLTGVSLVLLSPVWRFAMIWVIAGILVILAAGTAESIYFQKEVARVESIAASRGASDPEIVVRLRKLAWAATCINASFVFVIWLMVFKPGV